MRAILTAVLASILSSLPALGDTFTAGGWIGQSFYDDGEGAFSHCAMWANYQSGDGLVFSITDDGSFLLGIGNDDWRLDKDDSYPVALHIDRDSIGRYDAIASSGTDVHIYLPYSDELIGQLRKGRVLYVRTRRQTLSFKLTGTSAAFPHLQDCVDRERLAGRTAQNPFGGAAAQGHNPFSGDVRESGPHAGEEPRKADRDGAVDDRRLIRALLDRAGLNEFEYLEPERLARVAPTAVTGWIGARVIGLVYSYDDPDIDIGTATSNVVARFEDHCQGQFTYAVSRADFASGRPARRAVTRCTGGAGESAAGLIVLRQDFGTVTIAHIGQLGDADAVARADEAVYAAISSIEAASGRGRRE